MVRQKTVVMRQYDRYGWKGENMGKKEGQGENRISGIGVTARLIGITMIPIIAILIILTFISAKDMRGSMRTTQYQGMAGMAGSVQSAYNIVYQGFIWKMKPPCAVSTRNARPRLCATSFILHPVMPWILTALARQLLPNWLKKVLSTQRQIFIL